jgi:hypothetical protein
MVGQEPVAKFVAGKVSAAIWENVIAVNGWQVTALKATVQRRYKDKDGQWKSSHSFEHMIEGQKEDSDNSGFEKEVVV